MQVSFKKAWNFVATLRILLVKYVSIVYLQAVIAV